VLAGAALACSEDPTGSTRLTPDELAAASSTIYFNVVTPEELSVAVGGTAEARCQPLDRNREPLTNRNCNWRSRDEDVATVTGSGTKVGTITGRRSGTTWIIASATKKKDSVRVTVGSSVPDPDPDSPETLTSVHVTPASATAETGKTKQFSAYGRTADGDSVAVTPTWAATGGTVTSSGLYTAGSTAGTFRVIATASSKADTSVVTVAEPDSPTEPVPPPSEPAPGAMWACPSSGYTRLVNVSTSSQLSSALNGARAGDQIRIAAGTYAGNFESDNDGTSSDPIVICGATSRTALMTGLWQNGGSYVKIIGLVWQGPVSDENLVRIAGAHHVTFMGNEIRGAGGNAGLITQDVNNINISYNYIHDNGRDVQVDHGIYYQRSTGVGNVIANNLLVNNAARGISIHDNSGTSATDVLVAHNTIVGNGSTGLLVNDGDRVVVVNNISAFNGEDRGQMQIRVLHGNNNQVRNNLTYSPSSSLQGIENETSSPMSGNRIANPMFMSQFGDLRLQSGSPAIGLGLAQYIQGPDYTGKTRDAAPDAGAYER
jgi:hypothetical protein